MASSPDNPFRVPFNWQRQSLEAMAEAIDGSEDLPEHLAHMLTVEVGGTPSDVVYEENKLELIHYDAEAAGIDVPEEEREEVPILVVYALINRPYILDLQPDRSVVRRLLEAGHDVYLIRWNEPSRLDRHLTLEDYVTRYIQNCVDVVRERSGQDAIDLLGYCMGGTMAAMYAGLYPEKVNALGLMAAGLCFDDTGGVLEQWGSDEHYDPRDVTETFGNVPSEMLDVGFALMDPIDNYVSKYIRLGENIENESFLENFARMEKWLADGVDVAGEAYAEFLEKVYQNNELYGDELEIDGRRVELDAIDMPILQLIGEYDHLVPPGSSRPFNEVVGSDDVTTIEYETGHIGLSVSSSSHEDVWPEAAAWFKAKNRPEATEPEVDEEVPPPEEEAPATDVSIGENEAGVAEEAATEGDVGDAAEQAVEEAIEDVEPEAEAEGAEGAAEEAAGEAPAEAPDVETVDGIGPTYRDRLHDAGIQTTADLGELSAAEIAEVAQTSESRAQDWLDEL